MSYSPFKNASVQGLSKQAVALYKTGMSVRQVGKVVKRSHTWVWKHVKHLMKTNEPNH